MPRTATPGLFARLVSTGLDTFLRRGYRRTRVVDIARAAGVAPGTVYLYVAGKEALFELALRVAFDEADALAVETPYAPATGDWVARIWAPFMARDPLGGLRHALARAPSRVPPDEWPILVRDVWNWMSRYWRALALIERCADDWPELGLLFYQQFRRQALDLLATYIARRAAAGVFRDDLDPPVAARVVVETLAWFAMHRRRDRDAADLEGHDVGRTLLAMLDGAVR